MENRTYIGENVCSWGQLVRSPTAATKTYARAALAEPRMATRTNGSSCPRPGKPGPPEARNLDRWMQVIANDGDSHGTSGHDPLPADSAEPSWAADAAFAR